METIIDVWRQKTIGTYLVGIDERAPLGDCVDFVFTSKRMVIVSVTTFKDTTERWMGAGAIAGPLGLLISGAAGGLWNDYKESKERRNITPEMLDGLVANKLALSTPVVGLECEIEEMKRKWFPPVSPTTHINFFGDFRFGDSTMHGVVMGRFDEAANKVRQNVEKILPIRAKVEVGVDWLDPAIGKPRFEALTMKAIGKILPY